MLKLNTYTLLTLLFLFSFAFAQDVRNCGAMEHLEMLQQQNPGVTEQMDRIEQFTERYVATHQNDVSRAVVTIPVVVHVIYYRRSSAQNISEAQIQSQIDILNEDFRRQNTDAGQTRSIFQGVAADTEIEFCMATVDPNGNPTNGITRTSSRTRSWQLNDGMKFSSNGGQDAWPASDYLNIWVCDISSGYLGYAQFPGGPAATDGVVIDYAYFGDIGTATAPFDLGRTGTHEVGHWLNLRHIWGDSPCGGNGDFVGDTPDSDGPNYRCATSHSSCGSVDMVENYMDYSDDACMNVYTFGQKLRMQALFANGGARASLLSSNGCGSGTSGPTCSDGVQNGDETGVDCGGTVCPPCNTGGACNAPAGVSASVNGKRKKKVEVSWSAASGANSYDARLREVGTSAWSTQNTTGTSVSFNGLNGNTDYEYEVRSNCSGSSSAWTSTATVSARQVAARVDQDWMAFPNPADKTLNVQFLSLMSGTYSVTMVDMYGRSVSPSVTVSPGDTPIFEMSVSELTPGIYFLKIDNKDGYSSIEKVVIRH